MALRRVLDGEDRNQLEFEYEMSNLGWIINLVLGRARLYAPSEKAVAYSEHPVAY